MSRNEETGKFIFPPEDHDSVSPLERTTILETCLAIALSTLKKVRAHHLRINTLAGRPPENSRTLWLVNSAITRIVELARPLRLRKRDEDLRG
jgi:hypothetical protein